MANELTLAPGFSLPLSVVTEAMGIVATRGAGKSSASVVVIEEAKKHGVQFVVFDRVGVYWGLRSNAKGDGPGLDVYVLGGPHGDVPLEATSGKLIADVTVETGACLVLDLSDMSKSGAIQFAADYCERVYDLKARDRVNLLLLFDEAHFYAPQTPRGGFKGPAARLMGSMEDIVGLGRSRGLGAVLITQRTQSLNKAILDLIETLWVMRMLSPRARAAVKEWIQEKQEDDREGVLSSLPSLPTGTAWIWSPLRGILEKIALRRIETFDSYATPEPGSVRVEPTVRRELDVGVLGEQIKAVAEKVKADDPRELRKRIAGQDKRIAELEESLDSAPIEDFVALQQTLGLTESQLVTEQQRSTHLVEMIRSAASSLSSVLASLENAGGEIPASTEGIVVTTSSSPPRADSGPAPRRLAAPARRIPAERHAERVRPESDQSSDLTPARQRILNAMADLSTIKVDSPSKLQVALFAGASPKSSAFQNNISGLKSSGYLDYPGRGFCKLTQQGYEQAKWKVTPTTVEEIHSMVQRLVTPARWRILEQLIQTYPDALDKQELADRAGASSASSAYQNNVSGLRSLGLVDYPERGYVVATDVLFIAGV